MLNENMGVVKSLVESARVLNSSSGNGKWDLVKIILLSTAGISLISALTVVFVITNLNQDNLSSNSNSVPQPINSDTNLLQLTVNRNRNVRSIVNIDLTILGELSRNRTRSQTFQSSNNLKPTPVPAPAPVENTETENPVVRISGQGRVRGTVLKSRQNREYFAFYKVPYARPPLGKLRFALPEDPGRWQGIRDGTTIGPECIQREKYATEPNVTAGSEDCLHLNIYTPKLPENRRDSSLKLPVMFYIHGGGTFGNGTRYGANYFMDEDCVLITVNFRLGIFGGFTAGTSEFPGNTGARDQVQALKWVAQNIHRFGGDPKKVLIFGNSSGGGFVHAHLLSPMSQGLFHRAIMQSGSCITKGELIREPVEITRDFTMEVGCGDFNQTFDDALACLRNKDARIIALSVGQGAMIGLHGEAQGDDLEQKFLPEFPWDLIEAGHISNEVPIIVGVNSRETMLDVGLLLNDNNTINDHLEEFMAGAAGIPDDSEHTVGTKFRQAYFGSRELSNETRFELWNFLSDSFVHASRISGMAHANVTGQPVFFYWLAKEPAKSYAQSVKDIYPPPYGVAHADELQYLFEYSGYPSYPVGSPWFEFSRRMVHTWVSFARDGKPEIQNSGSNEMAFDWEPISLEDNGMKWLQLDDEIKYVEPFTQRMMLWDEYIAELYA